MRRHRSQEELCNVLIAKDTRVYQSGSSRIRGRCGVERLVMKDVATKRRQNDGGVFTYNCSDPMWDSGIRFTAACHVHCTSMCHIHCTSMSSYCVIVSHGASTRSKSSKRRRRGSLHYQNVGEQVGRSSNCCSTLEQLANSLPYHDSQLFHCVP